MTDTVRSVWLQNYRANGEWVGGKWDSVSQEWIVPPTWRPRASAMNTCKTCKYWGLNRGRNTDDGTRLKSCSAPGVVYGYHTPSDQVPDNGAAVEDDEGWGMQTGPDFGCVLHVSSPATPAAG